VLSRFNSLILARVFGHKDVKELAKHSAVPGACACVCVCACLVCVCVCMCLCLGVFGEEVKELANLSDCVCVCV
jgi:hypothetical protein